MNANGRLISKLFDPDYEFNSTFENYKSTDTFIIALFSILQIVGMFAWAYAVLITKNTAASVF